MKSRNKNRRGTLIAAVALSIATAVGAHGGDGVIEINQAKAEAGEVTPGDAEGFPVTISEPGSYRLTGNLAVPDANTTAIQVTATTVTLDLNGFSIIGPITCSRFAVPTNGCGPPGTGIGIEAGLNTVSVRNGVVEGMGGEGISASRAQIESVTAQFNRGDGFAVIGTVKNCEARGNGRHGFAGSGLLVSSTAEANGQHGIDWSTGMVENSIARLNGRDGIRLFQGTARGNLATSNFEDGIETTNDLNMTLLERNTVIFSKGFGLRLFGITTYTGNVIMNNIGGDVAADADDIEIGTNRCGADTTCP